ncbi:MAG: helix-turn-helix domain-containing protein [Defluviitaleaceae bacterium]|nr:helix-turn-helix domain-containing protein [Defluviitaleaceae bacterium]
MISPHILQNIIDTYKSITQKEIAIIDRDFEAPPNFPQEFDDYKAIDGDIYFKLSGEFVLVVRGDDDDAFRVGKLAAFHIESLATTHEERLSRDTFIRNLLLDNLLSVDINDRSKKLHIENAARRVVYLVETEADSGTVEILRGIFPDIEKDFVTVVDEAGIILVKELAETDGPDEIEQVAHAIVDTLSAEAMSRARVAIGSVVPDLKNVSASFKEARIAQEVGKIFEAEKQIVNFEKLGIGRLIYQLPLSLCHVFLNEMLQDFTLDDIDEEMFFTITKFFENDLNVSETARELFIHRNTLIYRLDKLQKLTRMDLRKFTDAITFNITLMVDRYVTYRERSTM